MDSLPPRNHTIGISRAERLGFSLFILICHFLGGFHHHSCFYCQTLGEAVSWGSFSLGDLPQVWCTHSTGGDRNGSAPSQISPLNRADTSRDPVHGPLGALEILRGRTSIPCARRMQNYGSRPPKVCNLIA